MVVAIAAPVTPSRETYGEPKKLAQLECERQGDHIRASVTRQGVTIIEVVGDVTEKLAVPDPYEVVQFWYKFLPAVSGEGFDAGPFLVTLHQTMMPETCERIDGKLVLRDLPGTPVADLRSRAAVEPAEERESQAGARPGHSAAREHQGGSGRDRSPHGALAAGRRARRTASSPRPSRAARAIRARWCSRRSSPAISR